MSGGRKKLLVVTVVWGDWHVGAFIDYTLPSLMAPGNFPALAQRCDLEYLIITRPDEQPRIESSRALQIARQVMNAHVLPALPSAIDAGVNIFTFHHSMWNFAYERAKQTGSYVFNLPPDSVFADGAGNTWAELLEQGKKSIFWIYPRAVDRVMPALREHVTAEGALVIAPRDLVSLNLKYLHPISKAFFASSTYFPIIHPEMIIWPVGDDGLLLRGFVGEGRLFDPNQVELSPQQVLTGRLDPDEHAFVADSDELYTIALAPPTHNAEWYRQPGRADTSAVGRWWLSFDGSSNDLVASRQVRIHAHDRDEAAWRPSELRANLFMSRAAVSREFFRIAPVAFVLGCSWTAALLTMAARTKACVRAFPRPMRAIVFAPMDAAVGSLSIGELLKPGAAKRFDRLMRRHVVVDENPDLDLSDRVAQAGGVLRLRSLAGEELILRRRVDRVMVNDIPLSPSHRRIGNHTVIPIEGVLDPDLARAAGSARGSDCD